MAASRQFVGMNWRKAGKMEMVSLDEAFRMKFIDRNREIVRAMCAVGATLGDSA
jgi:hypothetical protein